MRYNLVGYLLYVSLNFRIGEFPSNQSLGGEKRILGINHSLPLCRYADKPFAFLCERNYRWSGSGA